VSQLVLVKTAATMAITDERRSNREEERAFMLITTVHSPKLFKPLYDFSAFVPCHDSWPLCRRVARSQI
jgi:hypothetical protein